MMIPNPTYTTENEYTFSIKPIPFALMQRFKQEWLRRNPPPNPPKKAVTIVDKVYLEDNPDDQWFSVQFNIWLVTQERAETDFILSRGVIGIPPSDFKPDPAVTSDNPSEQELKALWIMECLLTEKDVKELKEAIISLNTATQSAVDEAQKN